MLHLNLPKMIKGLKSKALNKKFNNIEANSSLKTKSFLVLCIEMFPAFESHSSIGEGMKQQDMLTITQSIHDISR